MINDKMNELYKRAGLSNAVIADISSQLSALVMLVAEDCAAIAVSYSQSYSDTSGAGAAIKFHYDKYASISY